MTGIGDYLKFRFGKGSMQIPRCYYWRDYIVSSVNNNGRDMPDSIYVFYDLILRFKETVIDKVMTFNSGNRQRSEWIVEIIDQLLVGDKSDRAAFKLAPG